MLAARVFLTPSPCAQCERVGKSGLVGPLAPSTGPADRRQLLQSIWPSLPGPPAWSLHFSQAQPLFPGLSVVAQETVCCFLLDFVSSTWNILPGSLSPVGIMSMCLALLLQNAFPEQLDQPEATEGLTLSRRGH